MIRFYVLLFLILLPACSPRFGKQLAGDQLIIYPAPPDTTRIQYLTSFSNSVDVEGDRSTLARYIMGDDPGKPIVKPYGVFVHKGKVYICDTMLGGLEIIDLKTKQFYYFEPGGLGQLKKPINCFVDDENYLYVSDSKRKDVVVFDQNLNYAGHFGDPTKMKPTAVYVAGNCIYVTDIAMQRVHIYSRGDYRLLKSFPENEIPKTDPFLSQPTNLFVHKDRIYVTDFGAFKVEVFDMEGQFIRTIGSYGRALGQFVRPKGLAIDKNDILYVVDAGFENVQMFDLQGRLLMFFGGPYEGPGGMWLPAQVHLDYENLEYFERFVNPAFKLRYLIFVTNQYGPDKLSVYGFVEPRK